MHQRRQVGYFNQTVVGNVKDGYIWTKEKTRQFDETV
jgi:hypothetical protein